MLVTVMSKSSDWLDTIWTAARTCHSSQTPQRLFKNLDVTYEQKKKFLFGLVQRGHCSILEHASITFGVSGVSRALLAQYSRHRIAVSLSVQSQRYVSESSQKNGGQFDFVVPPKVATDSLCLAAFVKAMECAQTAYDALINMGIPPEDARFVLPNAATTNFVTTLNLRSLLDLYGKRVLASGAQWEIRELVGAMAQRVIEAEPWTAPLFK